MSPLALRFTLGRSASRRIYPPGRAAFTLIELLVTGAILLVLMLIFVSMVNQTGRAWTYAREEISEFRNARNGFEAMTRRLSQATLNTYWAYDNPNFPRAYIRQSELRFISGPGLAGTGTTTPPRPTHSIFFQAPLGYVAPASVGDTSYTAYTGLDNLLNTWGYYIELNGDASPGVGPVPPFVTTPVRYRFRLMELMQPSQSMRLYQNEINAGGSLSYQLQDWFNDQINAASPPVHVLADNIIALVILPKLSPAMQTGTYMTGTYTYTDASLAPSYLYDSTGQGMTTISDANLNPKSQLPPVVQVTMVAVEEASFGRFQGNATTMPTVLGLDGLFTTVGDTTNPANPGYAQDLQTLEKNLKSCHINYRIFTTDVKIKGAKWSTAQTK